MAQLAINGGSSVRDTKVNPWPSWPVWDEHEEKALIDVLNSGIWSYNGPKEQEFNLAFAEYIGAKYAISAANGTVTIQLALEALGIGLGDEVIVPGLTWQGTAAAALDVNAIPVLVDVCEDTWCIDPEEVEKSITPRTKAIIPVHLYGSFADMDAIMDIAKRHNLFVIEDCAHKTGGEWSGRKAGSIGDIGSFSFQLSKHLTAGEGGAMTTNDPLLAEKLDALRNCGRRPETEEYSQEIKGAGFYSDEGNFIQSGNYRITEFQAAILVEALKRLPEQNSIRDKNGLYMNSLLFDLPGVSPMRRDKRETKEAYFNFAFRYHQDEFNSLPVDKFRKAFESELGIGVDSSYEPLNICSLYAPLTKPARYKINDPEWAKIDPSGFKLPVCERIFKEESVCLPHKILLGNQPDMDLIAKAIEKIRINSMEVIK
ncbi:MAG: DegT/DnrJ/EryC1/StrS family aminotransferase [Bacteroidetes bacterium]|jgi:L-glutamine:2-deoxy-scyllo-inosose/3-amino-2,3-dideoxy-scyllo-inosose aminotransferase|nr:DegT/DnrJ/EryC1/StrS family aminotransferase [Bacteroidota bacterium]MBT3751456.1 DegT/DnrJ/EryC1/StrS family aminotransferase [Bacteroidota bacterium]MBT4399893.1 DegT/DnrJ/EryC1/StrS family aminotransferase [Bacteroidota bacterium]MBT4410943.1 DegT/DnrJ/EryC1/StrS family aminotransferase [Bacteroidota bacterium]MBT5427398.1 DegT/DnrJ/EryC1/StrS family aminotransferase [Bacteroidota bacterium]